MRLKTVYGRVFDGLTLSYKRFSSRHGVDIKLLLSYILVVTWMKNINEISGFIHRCTYFGEL